MNNPGSILKLWNKAVKTHETDKDPKTLPKKGQEQKSKVKHGLTTLKFQGAADMTAPANAQQFVVLRDKVGKLMTRYCRYLKAAKDEDKKILPKYLKTVTQLTALVLSLDPGNLSQDEEDPSLESLAGVDVAAVEKALAAPDTGEDIDLDAPPPPTPAAPATPPKSTPAKPAQAKDAGADQAAIFKTKLQSLLTQIQQAGTTGASAVAQAKALAGTAGQLAAKKEFDQANKLLDQAAQRLGKAQTQPKEETDQHKDLYLGLMSTLPNDLAELKKLDAAAASRIEPIVTAAAGHAKKGDYKKAFTYLDQAATALAKALSTTRAKEAKNVIPEGKVAEMRDALSRAQNRWDAALAAVQTNIKPAQQMLQANFPNAAVGLKNIVDSYRQDLIDVLREGQALTDPKAIDAAVQKALQTVASLRAEVNGDKVLSNLEGLGLPAKSVFVGAFGEVEKLLQA